MSSPEVVALMLADGRLPTGGHTQSAGLEPAVRAGLGADGKQLADVAAYARDRLRTTTRVEAAVAVLARHVTVSAPHPADDASPSRGSLLQNLPTTDRDPRLSDDSVGGEDRGAAAAAASAGGGAAGLSGTAGRSRLGIAEENAGAGGGDAGLSGTAGQSRLGIAEDDAGTGGGAAGLRGAAGWSPCDADRQLMLGVVEGAWAARTPSRVLRGVSRRQGRAYLRLAARVWPDVLRYLRPDSEVARPVVVGVIGGVTGLSAEQVARLVAYDDVQTVVAASLKLLPVDPADAASWLGGLQDDIERLVTDVAPLTEIDKIPADGAPLLDVLAQNHATERMRLFHA